MNPETLRKIFQSSFDYKTYSQEIVHRVFGCNDVASRPELLDTNAEGDKSHFIGQMEDIDGRLLGFFYTRVADGGDVRRKRVGLRKLISPYLKYDVDGAIAIFDDGHHWRLSYICDLKEGNTSAKRFSYIMGDEKGQYKTPLERLERVAEMKGRYKLSDLREAFSVDALSKEFFNEYHDHYDIIVDELKRQGFEGATIHDYVKKMMGRIVFLHFLQKKRWLDNNPAFLRDLFFFSPHQSDFLEQVLEPLFFGIFNTESDQRENLFTNEHWDKGLLKQWVKLPYLNGGLFEKDEVDKQKIKLPASLFEDLFSFMASYNFTVDENDPDDAEIGVDPEMLGKIFESLLEDNKAKGAFYTPKEIVRYMCKESLIAYLSSQIGKSQSERKEQKDDSDSSDGSGCDKFIRAFVESHEMQPALEPYRDIIDRALREVKICDPAIGSGAFPMGLLNELWRCREALCDSSTPSKLEGVSEGRGRVSSRVDLKKEIIENNIYGVDIEKGAIDIARLRFWLSIVVDADTPEPLPNFDYKFMQGNSLIEGYNGFDLSRISNRLPGGQSKSIQLVLGLDSDLSRKNLQRLMRDYFSVTDHKRKASMRQAINDEVKHLISDSIGGTPAAMANLEKLDCSSTKDFFLWHTWFKDIFDKGGFDIVIGNPPYIQLQADGGKLGELYKDWGFYTFARTGDIYSLFYEQGWNILAKGGHLCYITSNKWMRAGYGEKTREFFTTRTNPILLVDLGANVFENATVDTNILLFSKASNQKETLSVTFTEDSLENLSDFVQQQGCVCSFSGNDSWVILSPIEQSIKRKIESVGVPLKDWDIQINYGIKTGFNDAFIITTEKREEILAACRDEDEKTRTAELIRPILRGRDIKRYGYDWAGLWLIATFPARHYDIEKYPAVKEYLLSIGIEKLEQTGKTHIVNGETIKARKKTNNKWFETQDSISYWDDLSKPKIVYREIGVEMDACMVPSDWMINNKLYMITGKHLQHLLNYLNSKIFNRIILSSANVTGGKGVDFMAEIRVPMPNQCNLQCKEDEVDSILSRFYALSSQEIAFIDAQ